MFDLTLHRINGSSESQMGHPVFNLANTEAGRFFDYPYPGSGGTLETRRVTPGGSVLDEHLNITAHIQPYRRAHLLDSKSPDVAALMDNRPPAFMDNRPAFLR